MAISIKVKNNLIDAFIIIVVAFISYFLLSRLFFLLFQLGRIIVILRHTPLNACLTGVLIGPLQGYVTAKLIRNRKLFVAVLPTISLLVFSILYYSISPYFSISVFWRQPYVICYWILLIGSAFLSARWVLKRREKDSNT